MKALVMPIEISDKWVLHMATNVNGIFHSINVNILGPFRYKHSKITRTTKISKVWMLQATCQLSSDVFFTLMEKYDTGSFLQALETHSRKTLEPD